MWRQKVKYKTRIFGKWRGYTLADCDCAYCLHYGGKRRGAVKCLARECVCKDEIADAMIRERREKNIWK